MQIQPIDVTGLISAILGISIVLMPVIGLTDGQTFERKLAASSSPDARTAASHESADH